ncbi:MAG: fimbrillin family protein [Bacteroidales bacterium]|nr:fimbrillin family protein [Bacteroidales bacterium]
MASCSQNETLEVNNDGNEILFGVSSENASRAAAGEIFSSTVKPGNFTVYASYNNADFFPAAGINVKQDTGDNSKWVTDGKTYYWPNTGAINFFAVRNGGTPTWNAADGGSLTSAYTVPTTVTDQKDFIYAYASSAKTANKVPLTFKHALSQVVFKAKNTNANIEVQIDEVQVCKLQNEGTFTLPTTTVSTVWSAKSGNTSYKVSFDKTKITSEGVSLTDGVVANTLLLLPQEVEAATPAKAKATFDSAVADGFYFLVKLSYKDTENGAYLWGSATETAYVALPAAIKWEEGKKYIYTFLFDNGHNGGYDPGTTDPVLFPITFSVSVEDFVNVEKDVNLNGETQDLK